MPKRKKKSLAEEAAELPVATAIKVWLIIILGIVAYIIFVGSQPATVSANDVFRHWCTGTRVGMSAGTSMAKAAKHYEIPLLEATILVEEYVAGRPPRARKERLRRCVSIRGQ